MSAIFILIGASLIVAIGFLIGFIWSVKDGQFDDDYTPAVRMLFENTVTQKKEIPAVEPAIEIVKPQNNKPVSKNQK